LDHIQLADLQIPACSALEVLGYEYPSVRKAGIKVSSVDELISKLRDEAKVIT
jgi:electron transfer flavoprotein beta subunit